MFDENHDGKISCDELSGVLRTLGHNHSQAEIADMIKHADVNGRLGALYLFYSCIRGWGNIHGLGEGVGEPNI